MKTTTSVRAVVFLFPVGYHLGMSQVSRAFDLNETRAAPGAAKTKRGVCMKKRKNVCWIAMALLLLCGGCKKAEIPMEDYVRSNPVTNTVNAIMKSDTGYYYCTTYGRKMSLHYYDSNSGQNIFLCSKPECRHDGDAFCTATSEKYSVISACLYGGSLYLDVVECTDTEYLYKLLRVSGDGTELTEVITYLNVNNTSSSAIFGEQMLMHRGTVVLPYLLLNKDNPEIGVSGTFLYDLSTGELTQLPEFDFNLGEGDGRSGFCGYGDYIYFNQHEEHKNTLSRYCLTDGSIEDLELLINYQGKYVVWDEDTIYYTQAGNSIFQYSISTKASTRHDGFFVNKVILDFENGDYETQYSYTCNDMITDGTYLYVGEYLYFHKMSLEPVMAYQGPEGHLEKMKSCVHVYDENLTEIAKVEIETEKYLGYTDYFSIAILDGMVYLQTPEKVFRCTLEDFLSGEPPFEELYRHEVEIYSTRDWE